MFNRRKKKVAELNALFGKVKDEVFDFEQIESYFKGAEKSTYFHIINDRTCNDIDFDEFFMLADRSTSKVGQQYLYSKLRTIENGHPEFEIQERLIEFFNNHSQSKEDVQYRLSKLSKRNAFFICKLFQDDLIKPPKWFFAIQLLSFLSIGAAILSFFNSFFLLILVFFFGVNFIIHTWNKRNIFYYIKSIPQLILLNRTAKELLKVNELSITFESVNGAIKALNKLEKRLSIFQMERTGDDLSVLSWAVLELIKTQFLLEPLFLFKALRQIENHREDIHEVFKFVGKVDASISVSSFRTGLDTWSFPSFTSGKNTFSSNDIYHPLIEQCVTNSIATKNQSVLLTGSNMSGKTTFIRTIGINILSSLTINTCFASHLEITPCKLHSAIRISDDLMNSKSYYFEEVLTIKEMIDQSEDGYCHVFLLDEIFKGTNTIERISAGKACLSRLNNEKNIVFVSTHDIELTELLSGEYLSFHFSENIENHNVGFDFKIKEGKLLNRNAIKILEINGYPEGVIKEANDISLKLDKE